MEPIDFDFDACCRWLSDRVAKLIEVNSRFKFVRSASTKKPSVCVQYFGDDSAAQFCVWVTGECDYDVHKSKRLVAHEWELDLRTENLSMVFERFLQHVLEQKSATE